MIIGPTTILKGNICQQAKDQYNDLIDDPSYIKGDEIWSGESRIEHLEYGVKMGCTIHYVLWGLSILLIIIGIITLLLYKKKKSS